jgi:hypothetical protein
MIIIRCNTHPDWKVVDGSLHPDVQICQIIAHTRNWYLSEGPSCLFAEIVEKDCCVACGLNRLWWEGSSSCPVCYPKERWRLVESWAGITPGLRYHRYVKDGPPSVSRILRSSSFSKHRKVD